MIPPSLSVGIVYPSDPFGPKVGGPETFLKGFVRYAPDDFEIRYVGVTADPKARPVRVWSRLELAGRPFRFYPVFSETDENRKTPVPISLRFTLALALHRSELRGNVLFFDRIEPAVAFRKWAEPKIAVIHNDIARQLEGRNSEFFWSRAPWVYFAFERWILRSFDWVYTVSEPTLNLYRSSYGFVRDRLSFLPTWADPEVFSPVPHERRLEMKRALSREGGPPADEAWVLYVGRFQTQKAPMRLIETFAELGRIGTPAQLILVGEGNLRSEMEERVRRLGLRSRIHFLGQMPQERLLEFYRASDALLLTSHFEGMPRCVVEALSCGLPVVSTRAGEVARLIRNGGNGEIVDPYTPAAMAEALRRVLQEPGRYSVGECLRAAEEFRPREVLDPVYARIRELAGSQKNRLRRIGCST